MPPGQLHCCRLASSSAPSTPSSHSSQRYPCKTQHLILSCSCSKLLGGFADKDQNPAVDDKDPSPFQFIRKTEKYKNKNCLKNIKKTFKIQDLTDIKITVNCNKTSLSILCQSRHRPVATSLGTVPQHRPLLEQRSVAETGQLSLTSPASPQDLPPHPPGEPLYFLSHPPPASLKAWLSFF